MNLIKNFLALNFKSLINIAAGLVAMFIITRFYGLKTLELVTLSNAIINLYIISNNIILDVGIKQILQSDLDVNIYNILILMIKNSVIFLIFNILAASLNSIDLLFFLFYSLGYIFFSISSIFRIKSYLINNFIKESIITVIYKIEYVFLLICLYSLNISSLGVAFSFFIAGLTYLILMWKYAKAEIIEGRKTSRNINLIFFLKKSNWMILIYLGIYFSSALVVLVLKNKGQSDILSIVVIATVLSSIISQFIGNINDIFVKRIFDKNVDNNYLLKIYFLEIFIILIISFIIFKLDFLLNFILKVNLSSINFYYLPYFIVLFCLFSTNTLITNRALAFGKLKSYSLVTLAEGLFILITIYFFDKYTLLIPFFILINSIKIIYFLRKDVYES